MLQHHLLEHGAPIKIVLDCFGKKIHIVKVIGHNWESFRYTANKITFILSNKEVFSYGLRK